MKTAAPETGDFYSKAVTLFNRGDYEEAVELLINSSGIVPKNRTTEYLFLLMKSYVGIGNYTEARGIGRQFMSNYPLSRYMPEVFVSFGDMFINEGNHSSAFRMYLDARRIESNRKSIEKINKRLLNMIQLGIHHDILDEILALEFDQDLRNIIILAKANTYLHQGDPDNCSKILADVTPFTLEESFSPGYEKLYLASYSPPVRTFKVGVIAPLSGEDRDIGEAFIAGLEEMGNRYRNSGINISYIIRDNQSDDVETIKQVNFLKKNRELFCIIGPLSDNNVLAAAATMEEEQIPLFIPMSKSNKIVSISENIYQLDASYAEQGKVAARYTAGLSAIPEIAILAPADEFGQEIVDAYMKELDQLELHPAVVEWYYDLPENLTRQFQSIRKTAWNLIPVEKNSQYLGLEIDSLDALFDVSAEDFFELPEEEKKSISRSDSLKTVLETIDVIFIPVHKKHLKFLATQFPMHNIKAKVLGTSGWLDEEILTEDNVNPHYSDLVILTPQFLADSLDRVYFTDDLINRKHLDVFSTGLDVAYFLTSILAGSTNASSSFQDLVGESGVMQGISRFIDFNRENRQINNGMQIIEYKNSKLTPLGIFLPDSLTEPLETSP